MKITNNRLRYLIRESLKSSFSASGRQRSHSSSSSNSSGVSAGTVVRYDAAAVSRAKAAGLTDEEAGSPDNVWQFKFSGSGDARVWHASKDGSSWKNIGNDEDDSTIKKLNAAFPESTIC